MSNSINDNSIRSELPADNSTAATLSMVVTGVYGSPEDLLVNLGDGNASVGFDVGIELIGLFDKIGVEVWDARIRGHDGSEWQFDGKKLSDHVKKKE